MFFVGATGHLLTLLLTVLLPFVFLIGGNKNIDLPNNQFKSNVKTFTLKTERNLQRNLFHVFIDEERENSPVSEFEKKRTKIPIPQFQVLWKCNLLLCSGNKAPPLFKLN